MTPLVKLGLLICLHLLFSAAYIAYFSDRFDLGERVIVLHIAVVATLISIGLALAGLVLRISSPRVARVVIGGVAAGAFVLLALLYAANLLSYGAWGHNVTSDLATRYLTRPWILATYLGAVTTWPAVAAYTVFVLAGAFALYRATAVVRGLEALARALRGWFRFAAAVGLIAAAGTAAAIFLVVSVAGDPRFELLAREPVLGFFFDAVSVHRFALSAFAVRFREEGLAVRSTYPKGQSFDRRNVVLIVADSVRADHLSLYGYERPTSAFLERLAASGRLRKVRLAEATCPASNCAISSILSSKTFGSMVPENYALHEVLADQGYDVNFILSGDHKLFGLRRFYGDDITRYFDGTSSRRYAPTDDHVLLEGLEEVPRFSGKPAFFYFHLMSSHVLGVRQEGYVRYRPSIDLSVFKDYGGIDRQTQVNSYDNGIAQVDAMIEHLFDVLDEKGYLANAVVVISSDHGEGLGEHDGHGHAFTARLYQEFLRIPLVILDDPAVEYRNLELARQVDIAPTILDRLGLEVPPSWEGTSLLDGDVRPFSYHYMDMYEIPLYAVLHVDGDAVYKYLVQSGREELFDLTADPNERRNLMASAAPAVVRRLRARLSDVLVSATEARKH